MGGAGAAGAAAAIAKAIKASGAIVRVEPEDFQRLVEHNAQGLVVHSSPKMFQLKHRYMMGYKGLAFYTKSREPLALPRALQVIEAKQIWVPGG
ncbi:MAG TPA: hypothetical protein VFQ07_06940 [Candidatus Polarisedimenticolia bacterium]|nr:hypothetical protein [Candidatus Polarisedimenticolia bacterium]